MSLNYKLFNFISKSSDKYYFIFHKILLALFNNYVTVRSKSPRAYLVNDPLFLLNYTTLKNAKFSPKYFRKSSLISDLLYPWSNINKYTARIYKYQRRYFYARVLHRYNNVLLTLAKMQFFSRIRGEQQQHNTRRTIVRRHVGGGDATTTTTTESAILNNLKQVTADMCSEIQYITRMSTKVFDGNSFIISLKSRSTTLTIPQEYKHLSFISSY